MIEAILITCLLLVPLSFLLGGIFYQYEKAKSSLLLLPAMIALALASLLRFNADSVQNDFIAYSPIRLLILGLILFISVILIRFSKQYMAIDENRDAYYKYKYFTLASVTLLVLSNHLILLWLSWISISLNLHHLLVHYKNRPKAQLAAHKKFLFARFAEALLLVAGIILYQQHHTLVISEMMSYYQDPVVLSFAEQMAALFIGVAALIKCAQMPFHGWLMQVVEAPNPVSALLHAGVINLGGILLLIFAPLFSKASLAIWVVGLVGVFTTVLAALVMRTRVSYKVSLAWSTSAQMGLMLVECALGAWDVFIVHLISHSLYKAYAFLNSGEAVNQYRQVKAYSLQKNNSLNLVYGMMLSGAVFLLISQVYTFKGSLALWVLMAMGLSLWIYQQGNQGVFKALAWVTAFILVYIALKSIAQGVIPETLNSKSLNFNFIDLVISLAFVVLFITDYFLQKYPQANAVKSIERWLYSGFYIDEFFTALTLKIWPVRYAIHQDESNENSFLPQLAKES